MPIQQRQHIRIIVHHAVEEHLRLLAHRIAKRLVVTGIEISIRLHALQILKMQPLTRKVCTERIRPRIQQHAMHLGRTFNDAAYAQASKPVLYRQFAAHAETPEHLQRPVDRLKGTFRAIELRR